MKSPSPRLKRTPPKQGGPIRNTMASPRSAPEPVTPNCDPITATGEAVCGALENGVRTAYQVIDEYMRRGHETARNIFNDPIRRASLSEDRGNAPGGFTSMSPLMMFAEQWMMAMRPLSLAMSAFLPNVWQQPGMPSFAANGSIAPTLSVKVLSTRPVEVTANVYPSSDQASLVSDSLVANSAKATPIAAPEIVRESGRVAIVVKVEDKQPAGQYTGLIRRRADGSLAGDLTVIVT
ncbi:MAG: hypothetical protein WBE74_20965 [Terracidiphilus sp.]